MLKILLLAGVAGCAFSSAPPPTSTATPTTTDLPADESPPATAAAKVHALPSSVTAMLAAEKIAGVVLVRGSTYATEATTRKAKPATGSWTAMRVVADHGDVV